MALNQKGFYSFRFTEDGDLLRMRFDFNAIADIEDLLGMGIGKIFSEERMGFSTIRAMFWAGLKWKMKGLTIQKTGQMLQEYLDQGGDLEDLTDHLVLALKVSGIISDEENEEDDGDSIEDNSTDGEQEKN